MTHILPWIFALVVAFGALAAGWRFGSRAATAALKERDSLAERFNAAIRSEEHTSELQSLMRISYAVFCLKKKKNKKVKNQKQSLDTNKKKQETKVEKNKTTNKHERQTFTNSRQTHLTKTII